MNLQEITSLAQFNEIINGDKVVAIDFWATCEPITPSLL